MGLTNFTFQPLFIKNESHGTIHTFKNDFTTVFSIFSFQQNKWYPNGFLILKLLFLVFPNVTVYGNMAICLVSVWNTKGEV